MPHGIGRRGEKVQAWQCRQPGAWVCGQQGGDKGARGWGSKGEGGVLVVYGRKLGEAWEKKVGERGESRSRMNKRTVKRVCATPTPCLPTPLSQPNLPKCLS